MVEKNKKLKLISPIIIIFFIITSFLFYSPKKAHALGPVTDFLTEVFTGKSAVTGTVTAVNSTTSTGILVKNVAKEVLKQIIMTVERRLLAEMTKSMVNWINSGFHGSPLFLQNPDSFFRDIAKYEVKTLITLTGYDPNRFPFGKDMALQTLNQFNKKFADNAAYSLSKAIQDPVLLTNLRNNFNFGGWNGFLINTQYPQNNYLGYRMLYTEELARRLEGTANNNAKKVKTVLDQGMGFLSPQMCADKNTKYNNGYNEFQRPSYKPLTYEDKTGCDVDELDYEVRKCDEIETQAASSDGIVVPANCKDADLRLQQCKESKAASIADYEKKEAIAKADWTSKNTCKNLVATTPGSVVANQIVTAMSSNFRQTELGAALGSSMSAIFDALLSHFINQGLSSLATKTNPKPPADDFSYEGVTLGSPDDDTLNSTWDSGPDEPVILSDFKKLLLGKTERTARAGEILGINPDGTAIKSEGGEIIVDVGDTTGGSTLKGTFTPGDIDNTKTELTMLDNDTEPSNPGIRQMINRIWPKIRELDMCQPGPDLGWQDRLIKEMDRNSQKLQEKATTQDGDKAAAAQLVYNELQFAVNAYRDWVNDKMLTVLPNSPTYLDAIKEIDNLYQKSDETITKKTDKVSTLARLIAIGTNLESFTTQPAPGSEDEKRLINLWKKYKAIRPYISSTTTTEETKNDLSVLKDQFTRLDGLIKLCNAERLAKGWAVPGGIASTSSVADKYKILGTEKNIFCDAPIKGGYDHESFKHENDGARSGLFNFFNFFSLGILGGNGPQNPVTHPDLPYINATDVLRYLNKLTAVFTLGIGGHKHVNIQLSCNVIFQARIQDYKKNIPGLTTINEGYVEPINDITDGTESGTCTYNPDPDTGTTPPPQTTSLNDCLGNNGASWNSNATSNNTNTFGGLGNSTPPAPTGVCTFQGNPVANISTQSVCESVGATWTPNAAVDVNGTRAR